MPEITSFTILEIIIPLAYLLFSMWTAYTSGYNMALMKRQKPRGAGKYGPYLSVLASFAGIAIVVFLALDAVAYESGFLRVDLPAALYNLDFFTFLARQFTSAHYTFHYILYLVLGVVLALTLSYVITKLAFTRGKSRI